MVGSVVGSRFFAQPDHRVPFMDLTDPSSCLLPESFRFMLGSAIHTFFIFAHGLPASSRSAAARDQPQPEISRSQSNVAFFNDTLVNTIDQHHPTPQLRRAKFDQMTIQHN